MTPQERAILQDAEDQAFETAQELYNPLSSGIRPPPTIEETESSLEGQLFGLEFGAEPQAQAFPGASTPIPPPITGGACCEPNGTCSDVANQDACTTAEHNCTSGWPCYLGDGTSCATDRCEGSCNTCKTCLGPVNTCDIGFGAYDCGFTCYDSSTYAECYARFPFEGSIAWEPFWYSHGTCSSTSPTLFSGDCAHSTDLFGGEIPVGICCNDSCDCADNITEFDCFDIGYTCWKRSCECLGDPPFPIGCGVCNDSCGTGACCQPDRSCSVTTYSACIGSGGTYMGDSIPCGMATCG